MLSIVTDLVALFPWSDLAQPLVAAPFGRRQGDSGAKLGKFGGGARGDSLWGKYPSLAAIFPSIHGLEPRPLAALEQLAYGMRSMLLRA